VLQRWRGSSGNVRLPHLLTSFLFHKQQLTFAQVPGGPNGANAVSFVVVKHV